MWSEAARTSASSSVGTPHPQHLDALAHEHRVDALVRVLGGGGELPAPGPYRPRVAQPPRHVPEGFPLGPLVEVAPDEDVRGSQPLRPFRQQPGLREPFVLRQTQVAAHDAEARGAEPHDGRREPAPVQPGGERQQDVLGALDGRAQRAEQRGPGGGRAAGEGDEPGGTGEAGKGLAPAEEARGLLDQDEVGIAGADDTAERGGVVAHRADVVAEDPYDGRAVLLGTGRGQALGRGGAHGAQANHSPPTRDHGPREAGPAPRGAGCRPAASGTAPRRQALVRGGFSPGGPGRRRRRVLPCCRAGRRGPGRAGARRRR
ncbi:hypothetical protein GA0115246_111334 [Streptomyces sp. SolWspMP-sol7th]|nr:hypothetical protein GA0115246_111334 [Streptomyces sp. SolWspMP-sol7th]